MFHCIQTCDALAAISPEHEKLWLHCRNATFFQRPEYLQAAWSTMLSNNPANRLMVLAWYSQRGELKALFPFYCDPRGWLRFICDRHCDFCRELIDDDWGNHHQLIYELHEWIVGETSVRGVCFDNLEGDSVLLNHIKVFQRDALVYSNNEYSFIQCKHADKPMDQLAHISSKRRINLRNDYMRVPEGRMTVFSKETAPFPMAVLQNLREIMIHSELRSRQWLSKDFLEMLRQCYDADLLEIAVLYSEEQAVSAGINFADSTHNFRMHYLILYAHAKFNVPNILYYITKISEKHDTVLNFGRGGYAYKINKFKPEIRNLYRLIYGKTLWLQGMAVWQTGVYFIRQIAKKRLRK